MNEPTSRPTLTFDLDEEVTPDIFAARVAEACLSYGTLRPGEGVLLPSDPEKRYEDSGRTKLEELRGMGWPE